MFSNLFWYKKQVKCDQNRSKTLHVQVLDGREIRERRGYITIEVTRGKISAKSKYRVYQFH